MSMTDGSVGILSYLNRKRGKGKGNVQREESPFTFSQLWWLGKQVF
jgi:hypothetical protein